METNRKKLMDIITESSFALFDIILYLDTHPCDKEALRCYNDYMQIRKVAIMEYTEKFGPLNSNNVNNDNYFDWVCGPWPWEGGCN